MLSSKLKHSEKATKKKKDLEIFSTKFGIDSLLLDTEKNRFYRRTDTDAISSAASHSPAEAREQRKRG